MTADNPFRKFWGAGFRRLVPIVPPGAPISEKSTLFKRPGAIGKAPGVKGDDGLWRGMDWLKHATTEPDLERWHDMGAGVGIRTGEGLVALDIDTLVQDLADDITATAGIMLGDASACRIGRWPKRLILFRTSEPVAYQRVKFEGGLVELLSDDRQFVAHGIHPVTGKPYDWPRGIPSYDELPIVTAADIDRLFAALADDLPEAQQVTTELKADRGNADQAQLLGYPYDVAAAVAEIPNTSALFPTYDDYIKVGLAIKGATQDDAVGLEIFQAWAARWTDGENDPDRVEADWHRCKPPFSLGAQYLYHLASTHGSFNAAETWFTGSAGTATNPFDQAPPEAPQIQPIRWLDPQQWEGVEPPPREWEVDGWIPRKQVTLLYGEGGIGKTLAMHQYAVCAAAGRPWLGQQTRQARVTAIFCEDDEDELQRRHHAILKALGVSHADLGNRFRMVSRTGEDNLLATLNRASGALQPTAFYRQVREDVADWQADVTIVDTIADTFGGSEIDRGQVNAFVKTILGGLVKATGGSVVALGHPSVAGRTEGRSGSTAWSNAARSRIYLRYPKGQESGNVRELAGTKSNYGPRGALLRLKWSRGAFEMTGESKPEIDLNALKGAADALAGGPVAERGNPMSLEVQEERAVLAALAAAQVDRRPLNLESRSHAYAPRVLKREYGDLVDHCRVDTIEGVIAGLVRRGAVRPVTWREAAGRNAVSGYELVTAMQAEGQPGNGVFD